MMQDNAEKDKFCPHYRKVAYHIDAPKEAVMTRLRCKQWSCPYCRQKNASIWYMHLKDKLPKVSQEWWIMTLTANETTRGTYESLQNIREQIATLFKRMDHVWPDIEYVRVYERHPTSEAIHAHFIVCNITPYVAIGSSVKHRPMAIGVMKRGGRNGVWACRTWLKITARDLHMGYMADIRLFNGPVEMAVRYLSKYLFKDQSIEITGLRHVVTTKGIGSPKFEKKDNWETALYLEARMFEPNARIEDLNTEFVVDNDYWEVNRLYPLD